MNWRCLQESIVVKYQRRVYANCCIEAFDPLKTPFVEEKTVYVFQAIKMNNPSIDKNHFHVKCHVVTYYFQATKYHFMISFWIEEIF